MPTRALFAALGVAVALAGGVTASAAPSTCGATICPGDSLNAAYQSAPAGVETVFTLGSGDYGDQTIDDAPGKETAGIGPHVIFEPAPGAVITANSLRLGVNVDDNNGPDHLTVRGFTLRSPLFVGGNDANDILVENIDAPGFYTNGVQNLTLKNGDWGPAQAPGVPNSKVDGNPANANIRIIGGTIHDYIFGPQCSPTGTFDCHGEGLFVSGCGTGFLIDGVRFWRNQIYDVFVQPNGVCSGTIQNNWFGRAENSNGSDRGTALTLGTNALSDWLIRFNSFAPGERLVDENGGTFTNVRAIGNIFGMSTGNNACIAGITYSFNIWLGGSAGCNATERVISALPYVNPSDLAAGDYHLTGGVPVDFVTSTSTDATLATDFDGQARSAPRDAGSDEIGGTPPPAAQCADGLDNDADGKIDLADPGCTDAADNSESPDPPPPVTCAAPVLVAGVQTDTSSILTWAAVPGATGYHFYRNGVAGSTTTGLTVKFLNLKYGTTILGVAAICPDGEKLSNVKSVETRVVQ